MTINGMDITVEQLISGNEINWNVSSDKPLTVKDIRDIQRLSGYDPVDYHMGKMRFTDKGASWHSESVPTV